MLPETWLPLPLFASGVDGSYVEVTNICTGRGQALAPTLEGVIGLAQRRYYSKTRPLGTWYEAGT